MKAESSETLLCSGKRPISRGRDPLKIAAKEAASRGWHVFPCVPDGKAPATAHWLQDAQPTVRAWPRNCNVGIACGPSGLLVVDLDVKNDVDGVAAFQVWTNGWPDTYTVATPSGGFHLYYSDPGRHFSNGTGSLPKGIDVRGRGGYVLGAGSVVKGRNYKVVNDTEPIPIPDYLATGLSAPPPRKQRQFSVRGPRHRNNWETLPPYQVNAALNRITARAAITPPGERNRVLYWAACRFAEAVAAGRIAYEEAADGLLDAAQQCGLVDDDGEYAVLATIESGLSHAEL